MSAGQGVARASGQGVRVRKSGQGSRVCPVKGSRGRSGGHGRSRVCGTCPAVQSEGSEGPVQSSSPVQSEGSGPVVPSSPVQAAADGGITRP